MKIDWMELKQQSKKYIGHNVIVLLCGVLALVFLALAVVAIFSIKGNEGIAVKEAFDVSAAPLDASGNNFVAQLNGYLINYEDKKAEVDSILVVVGDGRERQEITLDKMTLYPRLAEEVSYEWKTSFALDRVHSVKVILNGQSQLLANSTAEWEFNPNVVLYVLLCAMFCFGTVLAGKKRYYRYQEDLIAAREEEETSDSAQPEQIEEIEHPESVETEN